MSTGQDTMRGGIVWVCEHGHVDELHKGEGNYSATCGACRDGSVCEPYMTLGRRSSAQRQRDKELGEAFPRFEDERRKRRARDPRFRVPTEIVVERPGQAPEVISAESLKPVPPTPPFDLSTEQRQGILHGERPPRIAFPRTPPDDHPADEPYPAEKGDVLPVTDRVFLAVVGLRHLVSEVEILYEIHDHRSEYSDKSRATQPLDPKTPAFTLAQQWRPEKEPQPVSRAEATALADRVHAAELKKLRRVRSQHGEHLQELASQPRDVRWPIKKAIEALDRRIDELEGQTRTKRHAEDVERRREAEQEIKPELEKASAT